MKQEYKILEFHGGTNNKMDPRDIADNQNVMSQFSVNNPGRLVKEGDAKNLYSKTDLNGHTITDITSVSGGFQKACGLHLFSHDYDMEGDEIDTEFICVNDANGIDIYDPNQSTEWQANKLYLGSRTATVKPEYYNVDGALRVCDRNFAVTDVTIDTDAVISKNDVVITTESGTIATGSTIQIEQEIMYVTSGSSSGTSITVIRGFANTKAVAHATNQDIYYVNVPKYFGHIKADRLFECATSNSVNVWTEDIQTPQPPNNTRKSDGITGTLESSLGIQSLRIYDIIEASTSNYPTESEKVVLEFEEGQADVGVIEVAKVDDTHVIFTTSGYGNDASGGNRLTEGEEITLTNMVGVSSVFNGTHLITSATATSFTVEVSASIADVALDYNEAAQVTAISGWDDHSLSGEIDNALKITVGATEIPDLAGSIIPIHITGETGVNGFNGIYEATIIDTSNVYIINNLHGSHGDGTTNGQVQQLIGIARPSESGAINPDLKRKWNFAMSFTYDGPGQEKQESLLTTGHTVYASKRSNGTTNTLKTAISSTGTTSIDVDDSSVFTANESVIMLEDEQMLITSITDADTVVVTRGYNNTTKDSSIAGDTQIYVITELNPISTVDWTNFAGIPSCVIKSVYNYGVDEKSWNARINGFKIYMKDVTEEDASKEFRLFAEVNFNKGTYTLFGAGDSELILEQPATSAIATLTTGTDITIKPIDTYLSENLFTEQTIIDAQYKASCVAGRKIYIGNIKQGGRTYPDRMLRSPVNKFDTFPETNFIDVAIGDGDVITALESFGDRLLQYKEKNLYVINIAGENEVLESEYMNAGVSSPSRVVKTELGIAWTNQWGLWFFDGQQVQNLTKQIKVGTLNNDETGLTAYDAKTNKLIFTGTHNNGMTMLWEFYDLNFGAFQSFHSGETFPHSETSANHFTNFATNKSGEIIFGYVDSGTPTELNFYKWSDSPAEGTLTNLPVMWKSKDIDFGSPAVDKKIYKIYVTYKSTGHSGIQVKYVTDGGLQSVGNTTPLQKTFKSSTYYDGTLDTSGGDYSIGNFTGAGTATGLKDTGGVWKVAELKPTESINNVKSIQLSFEQIYLQAGTARGGSSTTIQLKDDSSTSETDDAYNDYQIYIYGGPGRYNASKITDYDGGTETATVAAMTDKGYGNAVTSASKYYLGTVATDFEINDITIIYRPKRVK